MAVMALARARLSHTVVSIRGERSRTVTSCASIGPWMPFALPRPMQYPAILTARGAVGEPWEQEIALTWTIGLQSLEPIDEPFRISRCLGRLCGNVCTKLVDETPFEPEHAVVTIENG